MGVDTVTAEADAKPRGRSLCTALLIDGNNLVHRCWHAAQESRTIAAQLFVRTLQESVIFFSPEFAVLCIDDVTSWRHEVYPAYKAGRKEQPEALSGWIDALRLRGSSGQTVAGVRVAVAPGHEADDLLAGYANQLAYEQSAVLVSHDRDMYALVEDGGVGASLRVAHPKLGSNGFEFVDSRGVKAKLGVWPWEVTAYKALVGDDSDNLLGVPGYGPVNAKKLIEKHGSMPHVLRQVITSPPAKVPVEEAVRCFDQTWTLVKPGWDTPLPFGLGEAVVR